MAELLRKAGLLDALIDFYCEKGRFQEAFSLAEKAKHKLNDIRIAKAMRLEDENRISEAEKEYI